MIGCEQTRLVVLVADGTEISADDLEIGVLANIVLRHLEHPQVEVGYGAEGAASHQDYGLLLGIAERPL